MKPALGIRDVTDEKLQFAKQIGASAIVAISPSGLTAGDGPYYDYARVVQLKSQIEAAGLELAAIQNIPTSWYDKILWGQPGRDEQLDNYCRTITNVGKAGVPVLHYNFHAIRVWRTSRHTRVRGGALATSYDHALMENAPAERGELSEERLWENYEIFLRRIIPAAEAAGLKMALHPDDPPVSPIAGAACLFIDVASFQRALDMVPSPANGLLFCQGCYTEMLGKQMFDAIRHFGKQDKIFYVHFRNVLGQMPNFSETFIDGGDIDMFEALKVYKEVGFDGAMIPDHLPHVTGDTDFAHAANAHAIGYMRGMMEALGVLDNGPTK
jgi:mannonate dehydratase